MSDPGPPPIEARDLVKRYGPVTAVDGVSLTVRAGDVYGYLGPNGAGKTTVLRMLLGLIGPDEGTAQLFGRDPERVGTKALEGVAGFVEAPRFYPYLSGRRNLELLAAYDGGGAADRIDDALIAVELDGREREKVGGYSQGMRQRLGIAGALLRDPRLLLLDEPSTGLDPAGMRDMRRLVRRLADEGMTILLSSHLMGEVEELCDRLAIVGRGRVRFEGTLAELVDGTTAGDGGGPTALGVRTSDDEAARAVLRGVEGVRAVEPDATGLRIEVDPTGVDRLSLALAAEGIAVRELHASGTTLEERFFGLTEGLGPRGAVADGTSPTGDGGAS